MHELEAGIEELSKSFLSFSNLLLEDDMIEGHPRVASALQSIARQCVSLAQQGSEDPDHVATENHPNKTNATQDVNLDFDSEIVRSDLPWNTNKSPPPFTATSQWPEASPPLTPPYHDQTNLPFGIVLETPSLSLSSPSSQALTPPLTMSPIAPMSDERATLSHRLIRECCWNGYRLLMYSPDNITRIEQIFGSPLTPAERKSLISGFHRDMVGDDGDAIELRAKVLSSVYPRRNNFYQDHFAQTARSWPLISEYDSEEWLDASRVQRLLQDRGIYVRAEGTTDFVLSAESHPQLDISTFVRRKYPLQPFLSAFILI